MNGRVVAALVIVSCALPACRGDYFDFYDVVRTATELCDIQPQGEFCGDEGLPTPEQEGWAIEREVGVVQVFVDEEIWIATEAEDDDSKLSADKLEVNTAEPGPCTTTRERTLRLTADGATLKGKLVDSTRIEGGPSCGDSPRGERTSYALDGVLVGTP